LGPQRIVGAGRIPADRVGVTKCYPLTLGEQRGGLVVVQLIQLALLGQLFLLSLPPGPDGALIASITAFERL